MSLPSDAHKITLRTHIQANVTVLVFSTGSAQIKDRFASLSPSDGADAQLISDWYNAPTSPALYAWQFTRSRMNNRRAVLNTPGAGNQLDGLTGGKREALLWSLDDTIEPKLATVRQAIDDYCGSQNVLKSALLDSFKRQLTNVESVFTTGTKSFAAPGDNATNGGFEGTIDGNDILDIKGMPS